MNYKEFKTYVDEMIKSIADKLKGNENEEELAFYIILVENFNEICEENAELKKQLKGTTHCYDEVEHRQLKKQLEELLNQQQMFIKYLEDEIENKRRKSIGLKVFERNVIPLKHALQRFLEIIGTDTNVGSEGGNKDE